MSVFHINTVKQRIIPLIHHQIQLSNRLARHSNNTSLIKTSSSSSSSSTLNSQSLLPSFGSLLPSSAHQLVNPSTSFHPLKLYLSYFSYSFTLHNHQSPRHRDLFHSCNTTNPPQPSNSNYHGESGLFKELDKFHVDPATPPLTSFLNRTTLKSCVLNLHRSRYHNDL